MSSIRPIVADSKWRTVQWIAEGDRRDQLDRGPTGVLTRIARGMPARTFARLDLDAGP